MANSETKKRRKIKEILLKEDGSFCGYCGLRFKPENLTIDHIMPLSKGGKTTVENSNLSCKKCNVLKGNMDPIKWVKILNKRLKKWEKNRE